ncbi:Stage 0 sporulation A-like protein, partial [Dysosmobacter welbionis]
LVREVQAVAADLSVFSGYKLTGRGRHLEGHALQGLPGEGIPLVDHQCSGLGVFHDDRLRIAVFADDHVCGHTIHHIPCWGLDLVDDISTGGQIDDRDLALPIRGKDTVLRQGAGADHAIQPHLTASGSGHPELRTGKGLTGGAVPLLDDELALGLVLEGQADRAAFLDLNGLGLGINDIAVRSLRFRHNDALAGLQAGDADLAVFVRPEDAVAVSDQRTVRVGDLEFRVGEGHAGVYGTDLADQQDAVRGVVKADGDNTLLTAVRQVDRFRCVDDGVPIGGVNLLHDIGAGGQARPDGGTVLAGDLLPDGRAACAGGAAQKPQLEGAARECRMGHAVILLNNDGVQRGILEGQGLALAAVEDDLLGGGFLHLETGSGFHFRHGVRAGIEPLALLMEPDLTLGICEDTSVIDGGRSLGGFAAAGVGDVELGSLHRSASHAVLLVDGELGHFPIFESDIHLVTGVQADGLLPVGVFAGQVVRSGNRFFCNSVTAGGHAVRHSTVLAGGPIGGEITV